MDCDSSDSDGPRVFSNNHWESDGVRNEPSTSSEIDEENEMANGDDREADSSKSPVPDCNNAVALSDTAKGGQKLPRSLSPS